MGFNSAFKGLTATNRINVDPRSRAVYGVRLQLLDYWDCGSKFHWGHGCLLLVFVVLVAASAAGW